MKMTRSAILVVACSLSFFRESSSLGFCYNKMLDLGSENTRSISHKIRTVGSSGPGDCARACAYDDECLAFFVHKVNNECSLHSRPIEDLTLIDEGNWNGYDFKDEMRSLLPEAQPLQLWIESATNVSSEYLGSPGHHADTITGPYDVYPAYGDLAGAWASKNWSKGTEWIMVKIAQLLYIIQIDLYETFNAGGTLEISSKKPDGSWEVIWTTPGLLKITESRINSVFVEPEYPSDELWIKTNGSAAQYWVEIDAVKVIGWPV